MTIATIEEHDNLEMSFITKFLNKICYKQKQQLFHLRGIFQICVSFLKVSRGLIPHVGTFVAKNK